MKRTILLSTTLVLSVFTHSHGQQSEWADLLDRSVIEAQAAAADCLRDSSYAWNGSGVPFSRSYYSYDEQDNMIQVLTEGWNSMSEDYVNYIRWDYTYNGENEVLTAELFFWSANDWAPFVRAFATHDGQGNMVEWLQQSYGGGEWVNASRDQYTFDAEGMQTERIRQSWEDTDWVNDLRYTNTYDGQGMLTEQLEEIWSAEQWVNSFLHAYTYDAQGNQTEEMRQAWAMAEWVASQHIIHTYDAEGLETERISMNYESWSQVWYNSYRNTYAYQLGNLTNEHRYEWDGLENDWALSDHTENYYNCLTVSVESMAWTEWAVYPNPASSSIILSAGSLSGNATATITDMAGRVVSSRSLTSSQTAIDIADLRSGLYVLHFSDEKGAGTVRFVKTNE